MTLRHLEIFKTVTETENFTKAAEKLYISQSAVSHAIKELEEYTKTCLFDRMPKNVKLTNCGKLLLNEVLPILTSFDSLVSHMSTLEKSAPIRLVSSITIATFWLPRLLLEFKKIFPNQQVEVNVVSASNALEILNSGKADIALMEGAPPKGSFFISSFSSYDLSILCAPDYPITKPQLTLEEFCYEKLLCREKGSAIRDTLDSALYLKGYVISPCWTSVNSLALIEAAKAGLGITILPEVLVKEEMLQKRLIPLTIEGLQLKNELFLVRRREKYLTEPLRELLAIIENLKKH